jgi:hypothetical protein
MARIPVLLLTVSLILMACEADPTSLSPTVSGSQVEVARAESSSRPEGFVQPFAVEVFVDHRGSVHAGPGPHPITESSDYRLTKGGIRWEDALQPPPVAYKIENAPVPVDGTAQEAEAAVVAAEELWDGLVGGRGFLRDDGSPSEDPCGGENTVRWVPIDGPGGVLGSASICRTVATKRIVGFQLNLDSGETWSLDGTGGTVSVANIAAHEWGHIMGLGHVDAPRGGCLTMYRYSDTGEIQKATLGLGDKLGMAALYGSVDTEEGPGCGS